MYLTVKDILGIPILAEFRLIAGEKGLERKISAVNVLDFEYEVCEEEPSEPDGLFNPGALIITTLLYAKHDPSLILSAFKQLVADDVSAIAIKTIYYDSLPDEVRDYVNEKGIPVFFFRNADFENIIFDITSIVKKRDDLEALERELQLLLNEELSLAEKQERIKKYMPSLRGAYQCHFYRCKKALNTVQYEHLYSEIKNRWKNNYLFPYQQGYLQIGEIDNLNQDSMFEIKLGPDFTCGISMVHSDIRDFAYAVKESLYAFDYAKQNGRKKSHFKDMGIWQMLMPHSNDYWLLRYCNSILEKLKKVDSEGSFELYPTILAYVKNDFDVLKTAEQLIIHKNTVRYRLSRAREALGYEEDSFEFRQALFFAVMFHSYQKRIR